MNQKKCPKCGENNPAEAVMCWACYTPLTSGSALASGGAIAPGGALGSAPGIDEVSPDSPASDKQMATWQIGVIALALLMVCFVAFTALRPSGPSPTKVVPEGPPEFVEIPPPSAGGFDTAPSPPGPIAPPPPPPPPNPELGPEFTVVAPPNPKQSWATIGILLSEGIDTRRALAAAAAAGQQALTGGKWDGIHVYVFSDRQAASAFRGYQRSRGGAPVTRSAIPARFGFSSKILLRYELRRDGKQTFSLSSGNSSR